MIGVFFVVNSYQGDKFSHIRQLFCRKFGKDNTKIFGHCILFGFKAREVLYHQLIKLAIIVCNLDRWG